MMKQGRRGARGLKKNKGKIARWAGEQALGGAVNVGGNLLLSQAMGNEDRSY